MLKIVIIFLVYIVFITIIARIHTKRRNAKSKGFIIDIILFFLLEFGYLSIPLIKSFINVGIESTEFSALDIASFVIALLELIFTIFWEWRNYQLNKSEFRYLSFDEFEIKNPSFIQKELKNAEIVLISNKSKLPLIYDIIPNCLEIYVVLIKKIFNSDDLFNHYEHKDNDQYLRKVTISNIDEVKIKRDGNTTKYTIDFKNNNIENSKALNDILVSNAMDFEDKKMIKIKFTYKLVGKHINPIKRLMKLYIKKHNLLDEVSNAFNMESSNNNYFIFSKEQH